MLFGNYDVFSYLCILYTLYMEIQDWQPRVKPEFVGKVKDYKKFHVEFPKRFYKIDDLPNEEWRAYPPDTNYEISSLGRVRSINRNGLRVWKLYNDTGTYDKLRINKQTLNSSGYLSCGINGKSVQIHRLVALTFLNYIPNDGSLVVDHKNCTPLDNRVSNLRLILPIDNASSITLNSDAKYNLDGYSSVSGVTWHKPTNRWVASIGYKGNAVHLGRYDYIEEAVAVRRAARLLYGINHTCITNNKLYRTHATELAEHHIGLEFIHNRTEAPYALYLGDAEIQYYETQEDAIAAYRNAIT